MISTRRSGIVSAPTAAEGAASASVTPAPPAPACTVDHLLNCSFERWYPRFKRVSPRSVIVPLPSAYVKYMLRDRVVLPKVTPEVALRPTDPRIDRPMEWSDHSSDDADWAAAAQEGDVDGPDGIVHSDGDDAPEEDAAAMAFPALEAAIEAALEKLDGSCFVKTNWSAPRDAAWISGGLECSSAGAVYLLLQSSDTLASDVTLALSKCVDAAAHPLTAGRVEPQPAPVVLVLRKWCNLLPSMVFRCFMRERRIVGVTQRDASNYYPFLAAKRADLRADIGAFFEVSVVAAFPDDSVVFDVYVDRDRKVHLLDFNPWARNTDPVMFGWDELVCGPDCAGGGADDAKAGEAEGGEGLDAFADFEVRVVTSPVAVVPSDLCYYGIPSDLSGLQSSAGGGGGGGAASFDLSTPDGIDAVVEVARFEARQAAREAKAAASKAKAEATK